MAGVRVGFVGAGLISRMHLAFLAASSVSHEIIGVHDVEVRLHKDVSAQIQVEVQPIGVEKLEEAPAAEAAAPAENQ